MPTPRQHGGAALQPISLVSPAFLGLNTEQEGALLGPEWATVLDNAIFDSAGRIGVRKGFTPLTTSAAATDIVQVHEFLTGNGTSEVLYMSDSDIYTGDVTPTSIKGATTLTDGRISYVNFNDKVIGFNNGTLIEYNGVGNFSNVTVSTGTAPDGDIGLSAYGRLWGVDSDRRTIRYSSLLDETDWSTSGGIIDMALVWPNGMDAIVGLASFNGDLVVFGERQTVVWTDGSGSSLGIVPTALYVSDVLINQGAISKHAIQNVEGDLWFLSRTGVQSLGRQIQTKNNPNFNVSKNVQSYIQAQIMGAVDAAHFVMTYNPDEKHCIVTFPTTKLTFCFDTRGMIDQEGAYRATTWTTDLTTHAYIQGESVTRCILSTATGEVFDYDNYNDDGENIVLTYDSGWLNFGGEVELYLKLLKRIGSVVFVGAATPVNYRWKFDFGAENFSRAENVDGSAAAEFNICEFGDNGSRDPTDTELVAGVDVSEFGGGVALARLTIPARGNGQYVQVGLTVDTEKAAFSLQTITLFAKLGRLA